MKTKTFDLAIPVEHFATGWHTALARPPRIKTTAVALTTARPPVVSLRRSKQTITTSSYCFPEIPDWGGPRPSPAGPRRSGGSPAAAPRKSATRIQPPGDIIKLEDRLYYVLQPSLESLIASASVQFPTEPFPYQYEGIAFLYPRHSAILADEMGLGKSMQAIVTIRLLLHAGQLRRVLLICPKPLVTNWQREFALWAPELPLGIIEGNQARRRWLWREPVAPVKIANYELLARDHDLLDDARLHFDLVVLDEAQRIKNRASATSQAARSLPRTRSWALTGTPVENSSDDLVGIFEFLAPGLLARRMSPYRMARRVRDYVLRRTKQMVLTDLPPRLYRDAQLNLTPEQHATYRTAEDQGVLRLTRMGEAITIQHVFELVLRLKQICNFDPATGASSKLERLVADLEEVAASGQKAIVFSQWVKTLERLRQPLARFGTLQYHGQVPLKSREAVLAQFKKDPTRRVLLISYGAGGVGLNLQFCSYVFLFDRWWNPAVEDQAINRAHRIGASGPVIVTRLLTLGTIEERIHQVLQEKRRLFHTLLPESHRPRTAGLSQQEIFGLFNLQVPRTTPSRGREPLR